MDALLQAHLYYYIKSDVYRWEVVLCQAVHVLLNLVQGDLVGHDHHQQPVQPSHAVYPEGASGAEDQVLLTRFQLGEDVAHGDSHLLVLTDL